MVTDPLGAQRLLQHQNVAGRLVFAGSTQPCANCTGDAASTVANAIGKVTQSTDFGGVTHQYTYDEARQLPVASTRAVGRPEAQTRTIAWHPTFRLPVLVTEAGRTTAYTYDNLGNKLSETITDTGHRPDPHLELDLQRPGPGRDHDRSQGRGVAVRLRQLRQSHQRQRPDGPRDQRTRIDARRPRAHAGQPGPAHDGLHLGCSRQARRARPSAARSPRYSYTPTGQLASVSEPSGYRADYSYDAAQRLIGVTDNRGDSISYTLDADGQPHPRGSQGRRRHHRAGHQPHHQQPEQGRGDPGRERPDHADRLRRQRRADQRKRIR